MVGHDQPKLRAKRVKLFQPVQGETLDRCDQGARTPGRIGHAKSSPLFELEESSFRFVRHSVRWYRLGQRVSRTGRRALAGRSAVRPGSRFRGRRANDASVGLRLMRVLIEMIRLVSAWVLVNGLLMTPTWLSGAVTDVPAPAWLSLEAALIVGAMALLPRRPWSCGLAWILAAGVILFVVVSLADVIFRVSLSRSLNLSLDLYLLSAVYLLAVGNSGILRTLLGLGTIAVLLVLSAVATAWLLTPTAPNGERPLPRLLLRFLPRFLPRLLPRLQRRLRQRLGWLVLGAALALGLIGRSAPAVGQRLSAPAVRLVLEQAEQFRATARERETFAAELERQPTGFTDLPGLLSRLEGRNVVMTFIESYGMAALEDPEFATTIRPRLDTAAARIERAGLHLATGELASPTVGGQSWYAHGSMLSGLWLENQLRYDLLMASERETLVDDFRRAGYRTAAVMPAITTNWPEGLRLGYDDVYARPSIPYAGPPLYWVTIPDQFTWSFLREVVQEAAIPLFVEAAMVSSHAPWTPVLPLVDWDSVGDGAIFGPYQEDGHPPEELWWDVQALREGYARSLDYSLKAMTEFAERFLDERTLLVVVGDHQAAPWVTGASDPDVPVHVIAADAALLEPFFEWGFQAGGFPDPQGPPRRMDEFREWFVRAFSDGDSASAALSTKEGR